MQKMLSIISLVFNKSSLHTLPTNVSGYVLQSPIHKKRSNNKYATGIYKKGSKKVFIKTWTGPLKNFDYFSLESEIRVSKLLSDYTDRLHLTTLMNVPKIVSVYEKENQLSVISEYIDGESVSKLPVAKQVEIINKVLTALSLISSKISSEDRSTIPTRSVLWHVAVFIPKLIKSRLSVKDKYRLLVVVIKSLLSLSFEITNTQKLAHGDLLPQNIILKNKKIYVIDYGQTSFTIPNYDLTYLATQPKQTALVSQLLPHGFMVTQQYVSNIVAALSAVSADSLALQDYFIKCICA